MFILFETVNQQDTSIKSILLSKPDDNNNGDMFCTENTSDPKGILFIKKIIFQHL